ncbi:PepSY domain-containing protein [Hellea balneolensis]|uniref:PepSY domain-containing protein n=1 Tax=Hellea balneolensis TaxID=287478 RepID=UPI00138B1281|nr:PepSY domain-containing protein [Hellea balneolensis]
MTKRRHITLGLSAILWAGIAILPSTAQAEVVENIPFKAESAVSGINESSPETMTEYLVRRDVSASEAKRIARKRAGGGEVVDISRKGNTYRVRVIRKDGRVVDVLIDARTGRVK